MDRYPYHWSTILLGATLALAHIGVHFTHHVFGLSEINRPKAANRPVSYCTSFLELGVGDYRMALNWEGLASIPLCVIMKPRNRSALTSNAHFAGFSFIP